LTAFTALANTTQGAGGASEAQSVRALMTAVADVAHFCRGSELPTFAPDNITLLPLPPKCPELNPVENIWQFMRDNWLSNRIFKCCCYAWNKLLDQPWRIMSIGSRKWASGSDQ
jgi:hypothetical protein